MNRLTDGSLSKAEERQTIDERIAMLDEPEWDEGYSQPLRYPDEDLVYSNLNSNWYSHEQKSIESRPIKRRKLNPINNEDDDDDDEYYSPLSLFSPPPSPSDIIISQNSDFSYLPSSLVSLDHYFHHPLDSLDHYLHSNDELSNDNPFLKLDQQEIKTVKKGEENIMCDVEKQFEHVEEYGHDVPEDRIYCRCIDDQIFKAPRQSIDNTSLKKRRLVATQLNC